MFRKSILFILIACLPISAVGADSHTWSLDSVDKSVFSLHGKTKTAPGVAKTSLAFAGDSLLTVKDSSGWTAEEAGFTLAAWVNPYRLDGKQQVIAAKNRYALDERQWAVMIDRDNRFRLYVWQGEWVTTEAKIKIRPGNWYQVAAVVRPDSAELWVNGELEGQAALTKPIAQTKAPITLGGVDDNGKIRQNLTGALDEIRLVDQPLDAEQMAAGYKPVTDTHELPQPPKPAEPYKLWDGPQSPKNPDKLPEPEGLAHSIIYQPEAEKDDKFIHGAAIIHHDGVMYANWASSPKNENYPNESLRGKRSKDSGKTWSELEIIAPGFEGDERHSHGVYLEHKGELWTFCARFGHGPETKGSGVAKAKRFGGLKAEAFVLNKKTDQWESRGVVIDNCWPYDEPVKMDDGNWITGGQDKDGLPVIAISQGDDFGKKWDSVLIPYDPALQPRFAETTVWAEGKHVIAVIRGGGNVAWVSTSDDYGRTWTKAGRSNLHMPRSKAYYSELSTGQRYLIHNVRNRNTLAVSLSKPGEAKLSKTWRIRHGKSKGPRFDGFAKASQWSYPYGYEHDGKLYIVYSISKERVGLSVIPIESLAVE